jgi:hypothetical protein
VRLAALVGLAGLSGCAAWVWNQRVVDCGDAERIAMETEDKRLSLRIGQADALLDDSLAEDVEGCRAVLGGLAGSRVRQSDGGADLDLEEVRVADVGYVGDDLVLNGLFAEWGSCSESELGRGCLEGDGALIEIDRIVVPGTEVDNGLAGFQLRSEYSGRLAFDADGARFACAGCALEGVVASAEPVEVRVDGMADDVAVCIEAASVVRVVVTDEIALGAQLRIRMASPATDVELDISRSNNPFDLSIALEVATPPDGGYDWYGIPGRPEPVGEPLYEGQIRLSTEPGTAVGTVDTTVSAGIECTPGRPGWER